MNPAVSAPPAGSFTLSVRVYYEDTDAGGVVYHANYLRYLERARTEWLRSLGHAPEMLARDHEVLFVVSEVALRYRRPARLDDALYVSTRLGQVGRSRLVLHQEVSRNAELLLSATVSLGCVHQRRLRPVSLPGPLRDRLAPLSKHAENPPS